MEAFIHAELTHLLKMTGLTHSNLEGSDIYRAHREAEVVEYSVKKQTTDGGGSIIQYLVNLNLFKVSHSWVCLLLLKNFVGFYIRL